MSYLETPATLPTPNSEDDNVLYPRLEALVSIFRILCNEGTPSIPGQEAMDLLKEWEELPSWVHYAMSKAPISGVLSDYESIWMLLVAICKGSDDLRPFSTPIMEALLLQCIRVLICHQEYMSLKE